jgi:catechol 2,3-dioxygenase
VVSDTIYFMLSTHEQFRQFSVKPLVLPSEGATCLFALSCDSRAEVDTMTETAIRAGGKSLHDPEDLGFMYSRAFEDPDGNGLELYADRPRDAWPSTDGKLAMFTHALDTAALLATAPDARTASLPPGTVIGHVHLRTRSLEAAEAFHVGQLGLAVTVRAYPGALFLAADGYHHHIAVNTWGTPAPAGDYLYAGLERIEVAVSPLAAPRTLTDPDGLLIDLVPRQFHPGAAS